jgi:hypothetical protein
LYHKTLATLERTATSQTAYSTRLHAFWNQILGKSLDLCLNRDLFVWNLVENRRNHKGASSYVCLSFFSLDFASYKEKKSAPFKVTLNLSTYLPLETLTF